MVQQNAFSLLCAKKKRRASLCSGSYGPPPKPLESVECENESRSGDLSAKTKREADRK